MRIKLFILNIILFSSINAECIDLNYSDCLYWSEYCEWNDEIGQCQEIGGGTGGGENADGPYEFSTITESQGLRNGPYYQDGIVYYPINGIPNYKSIVLTPGWGGNGASMSSWAQFFASHGFIAMTISPNDAINDDHVLRAEGLLDGIETITQENNRINSPIFEMIDLNSFSVGGYSMGGRACQNAAIMDSSLKAVISLNPTVLFDDCDLCPGEDFDGATYCICLVPELISHSVPSLIFAGEVEVNELPDYDGMLGQDIYENMPENTDKIMFEGAGDGHGFAAYPYGEVQEYALNWLKYQVLGDYIACDNLLEIPSIASQYLINVECSASEVGDINGDSIINILDIVATVNLVLSSQYNSSADLNSDGQVDILDVVQLVNIILN